MPLENSLNVNPYFDDFDQDKEFYKVLFKPGVSVQTRELNQLQTMLQNQIEKFGDHIFKSGTILSGINFSYLTNYPYIKILDVQVDGEPVLTSSYVNYFVKSNLNLTAHVVNYADGIESNAPDLNTLYLRYVSSSDPDTANSDAVYTTFTPGQVLTVYNKSYPLFHVEVNNGGLGFSNSDTVVITSSIVVSGNTIAFSNGEVLTQSTTGAKVQIASINTTAVANTTIIKVKPRTVDLTNNSVNSTSWTLSEGYTVVGNTSGAIANVTSLIGAGATGLLLTDTQGILQTVTLSNAGANYTYLPTVMVKTANATATVNNLDLLPQNYKTQVTVASSSNSVGTGYAFAVTPGIIYQKGYFLQTTEQVVVVDKYSNAPDGVSVGFVTDEQKITAFADESLYDNASNTTNYAAPGADRLQLIPRLIVANTANSGANGTFLTLAEWKDGTPFREFKTTVYSNIGDEMARRTKEAQGNFVIDPFVFTSREKSTANTTHTELVIDPGTGYIDGYRVSSDYNTFVDVPRATTTATSTTRSITVNYGNYILVNELAGFFNFKAGATISLRNAAKTYVSTATIDSSPAITAAGSEIGTARMRSIVVNNGEPGTSGCTYRIYLFDVKMNSGYSFRSVRSVFFDGTEDGVADIVTEYDATTASQVAKFYDASTDKMLFGTGQIATKSLSNITYQYRTSSATTLQLTSSGTLAIGPLGTGLTFPYSDSTLSSTTKRDFIIVPIANNEAAANVSGSIALSATSNVVTGTSTSFATDFVVGDFIKFINSANTAQTVVRQITFISNNTSLGLNSNSSLTIAAANAVSFYPAMYPLALETRSDRSITISGGSKTATLSIGKTLASTVNAIATYSVAKASATPVTKTINRDIFVKIHTSNNVGGAKGPWSLGVPGIARLKSVYLGSNTTVNTSSSDITKYFYVDVGDDENAYRNGNLVLLSNTAVTISANQYLLVKFDTFTTGGAEGFFTVDSYSINDAANLASSTTTINTLEIPETVTKKGVYFDLRDAIDFRPYSSATANLSTTVAGATINPANTFALSGDDQFFPVPDSTFQYDIEYYLPRRDTASIDINSTTRYKTGVPSLGPVPPSLPPSSLPLGFVTVPPYPSLPSSLNSQTLAFASKKVGSFLGQTDKRVRTFRMSSAYGDVRSMQPRRYTMADIGVIERRVGALERQVALTALEKSITDTVLPSAITPSLDRFKNGFFIEPFVNFSRSESNNPEFAAMIDFDTSELIPSLTRFNFECKFDMTDAATANAVINNTLSLPYTPVVFIDQFVKVEPVIPLVITNTITNTITNNVYITNTVNNTIYVTNTVYQTVNNTVYVTNTVYQNVYVEVVSNSNTAANTANVVVTQPPVKPTTYTGNMTISPSTFSVLGLVTVVEDAPHITQYVMGPPPAIAATSSSVTSSAVSDPKSNAVTNGGAAVNNIKTFRG